MLATPRRRLTQDLREQAEGCAKCSENTAAFQNHQFSLHTWQSTAVPEIGNGFFIAPQQYLYLYQRQGANGRFRCISMQAGTAVFCFPGRPVVEDPHRWEKKLPGGLSG
ncbi:MAG: hypothetical protein KJ069_22955 [Anaerolineae bacterium]|nr:hypothetical protein [Anaerolineae bacterium]